MRILTSKLYIKCIQNRSKDISDSSIINYGKDSFDNYWMRLPQELSTALEEGTGAQLKLEKELKKIEKSGTLASFLSFMVTLA